MKPIASICVPTYNGETYLRECLDSILAQTFTNFEVLIVDDCSSDHTVTIAQEYEQKDSRIRVLANEENLGLVGNWNRCIELAHGEWIKFVFQDDLISPTCLEKMLAEINSDSAIVFCRRDFIFEEGMPKRIQQVYLGFAKPEKKYIPSKKQISAEEFCEAALRKIGINFIGEPTVVMIRKSAFEQFGLFNPHLIQICDFEMWARIASNVGIIYIPEALATFRVHSGATTNSNHTRREYRMRLDGVVLQYNFLFDPAYKKLRAFNSSQLFPKNLLEMMKKNAYFTWIIASRAKNEQTDENQKIIREWENILMLHPHLGCITKLNSLQKAHYLFLRGAIHWQWQIKKIFTAQFQT